MTRKKSSHGRDAHSNKPAPVVVGHENEDQYSVAVKTKNPEKIQKEFDFSPPRPRPLIAGLPAHLDEYEEGVARFFQWKTGLDYYHAMDQIIDFVVSSGRTKIVDLLTDTAVFALRIAGRKAFSGSVYSFDNNVTLLERAKQRAAQLKLQKNIEFKQVFEETQLPLPNCFAEAAVSIFDLHRHQIQQYLEEILRILEPEGLFIVAAQTEPKAAAPLRFWRWLCLKYIHKNSMESDTVYPDREELIKAIFGAGFRQVIIQEMNSPTTMRPGVFSLITATK
jgi:ubiquinone/menaquinone biosynthesis C-methylase UbiE